MRFLDREEAVLEDLIPGLHDSVESLELEQREAAGSKVIEMFRDAGGAALLVPTAYGGTGATAVDAAKVQRALGAVSPSLAVASTMHHFSVASLVEASRAAQGFEWLLLDAIAHRNKLLASGFAEGTRGQSIVRPALRARREDGRMLISGAKRPCSLAYSMDLLTASVVIEPEQPGGVAELAVVVVPSTSAGLRVERFWTAPVLGAAQSEAVLLDDVAVDERQVVRLGPIDGAALDRVQSVGFVWFELLMSSSYLGMASALVSDVLTDKCGDPSERARLAGGLETAAAAIESVAHGVDLEEDYEQLLVRALCVRYSLQETIASTVATAVDLLGGMRFIGAYRTRYFSQASRCLAFHPPSRSRTATALAAAFDDAQLFLS